VAPLGVAAGIGLVLYFVGAVVSHLRVSDFKGTGAAAFIDNHRRVNLSIRMETEIGPGRRMLRRQSSERDVLGAARPRLITRLRRIEALNDFDYPPRQVQSTRQALGGLVSATCRSREDR
jgi:hypothetical protein